MNSSEHIARRLSAVAVTVCTLLLFGASGAHAASTQLLVVAGPLAAEESPDTSDSADSSDEEQDSSDDGQEDTSDNEDSDNSDEEDSDSAEPTETPTPEPTFSDPTATDDVTEMPTEDPGETAEAGSSPLGWILLAAGLACAAAAIAVYRRNRHIM